MNTNAKGVDGGKGTGSHREQGDQYMQQHENTIHGEIARRAYPPDELDDFSHENDENHRFQPLGGLKGPDAVFSIQQDDFFVTIRIPTDGVAPPLLVSVSPRSVLLFTTPSEREIEDVLRFISIPVEIDPEQAEVSFQGEELVLVLPVSAAANRSA
jgi:hypothetical protein